MKELIQLLYNHVNLIEVKGNNNILLMYKILEIIQRMVDEINKEEEEKLNKEKPE